MSLIAVCSGRSGRRPVIINLWHSSPASYLVASGMREPLWSLSGKQFMQKVEGEVMRLTAESKQLAIHRSVKTRSCGCSLWCTVPTQTGGACSSVQSCSAWSPGDEMIYLLREKYTSSEWSWVYSCSCRGWREEAGKDRQRQEGDTEGASHFCFLCHVKLTSQTADT